TPREKQGIGVDDPQTYNIINNT
ncbi:unnamed protein product, partial [Rotaria magnacalcarata]